MNTGIVCEFNPFHNGHKYLIEQIKNNNNDNVICVMSGNFVQRGEFAVYDKFKRTKMALDNGADLVIELPCVYSLKSAQGFAESAINLLENTDVVDNIAFGAECDDITLLENVVDKINNNEDKILEEMKKGITYPAARKNIIGSDILDYPNNILAIEYIQASSLPCKAIKRIGKGHDTDDEEYSASAIRNKLCLEEICSIKNCESALLSKLRTLTVEDLLKIEDVNEGLENRIINAIRTCSNVDEIYDSIKTKRYTHSRIRRIILRAYLGITEDYSFKPPYIRVLGFNNNGKEILAQMKKNAKLPIISKYSDIKQLDENGKKLLELECKCTDLYNLGYKVPLPCGTEMTSKIVIK